MSGLALPKPERRKKERRRPIPRRSRAPRARRRTDRSKLEQEADRLFSALVRKWSPLCEACHSRPSTDCAHGLTRSYKRTRWCRANAWALCRECHSYFTAKPHEWTRWLKERLGSVIADKLWVQAMQCSWKITDAMLSEMIRWFRADKFFRDETRERIEVPA